MSIRNPTAEEARLARSLRVHLRDLTKAVRAHVDALDDLMRQPSTPERGRQIAALSNALEMANDRARYFGLGEDYRRAPLTPGEGDART